MTLSELLLSLESLIVVAIMLLALFCYSILVELCFLSPRNDEWQDEVVEWSENIQPLLSALPLLGLLGTISGLLETFFHMTLDSGLDTSGLMSSGIADAMFTTQVGLLMVIPGWLMHAWLKSRFQAYVIEKNREKSCDLH